MQLRLTTDLVSVERDDGPVESGKNVPACRPRYLTAAGEVYVAKRVTRGEPALGSVNHQKAFAEFAVAHWGLAFGVQVPEVKFLDFNGVLWVGSHLIEDALPISPVRLPRVRPESAFNSLLALDVFIENQDRHPGNALLTDSDDGHSQIWAIDHERSGLGFVGSAEDDFGDRVRTVNVLVEDWMKLRVSKMAAVAHAERVQASLPPTLAAPIHAARQLLCDIDSRSLESNLLRRLENLPESVGRVCDFLGVAP